MSQSTTEAVPYPGLPMLWSFTRGDSAELSAEDRAHQAFLDDDLEALAAIAASAHPGAALFCLAATEMITNDGGDLDGAISLMFQAAEQGSRVALRVLGDADRSDSFQAVERDRRGAWSRYCAAARLGDPVALDKLCEIAWGDFPGAGMPFNAGLLAHLLGLARSAGTPQIGVIDEMIAAAHAAGDRLDRAPLCYEPAGMVDCLVAGQLDQLYDCLLSGAFFEASLQLVAVRLDRQVMAGDEEGADESRAEYSQMVEQPALRYLVDHGLGDALLGRVVNERDGLAAVLVLLLHLGDSYAIADDELVSELAALAAAAVSHGDRVRTLVAMMLRIASWRPVFGVEEFCDLIEAANEPDPELMFLCSEALIWSCKHISEAGGDGELLDRHAVRAYGFALREIALRDAAGTAGSRAHGRACLNAASALAWRTVAGAIPFDEEPALLDDALSYAERALMHDELLDAAASTILSIGGNPLWRAVGHQRAQVLLLAIIERVKGCEAKGDPLSSSLLPEAYICLSQVNCASPERMANMMAPASAREALALAEQRGLLDLVPAACYALWSSIMLRADSRTAESDAAVRRAAELGDATARALEVTLRLDDDEIELDQAVGELEELVAAGDSMAMTILGEILCDKEADGHHDPERGESLLRRAAGLLDARAVYLTGMTDATAGRRSSAEQAAARMAAWGHAEAAEQIRAELAKAPPRGVVIDLASRRR